MADTVTDKHRIIVMKAHRTMLTWMIKMQDRRAPLDEIHIPAVREMIDPLRDHLAAKLDPIAELGQLTITFEIENDRSLSIKLQGDILMVNQARDILGNEEKIGPIIT